MGRVMGLQELMPSDLRLLPSSHFFNIGGRYDGNPDN